MKIREVLIDGNIKIQLFSKRLLCRLLCFLIMKAGEYFTAEELYSPIWCLNVTDFSEERSVKTAISRLRNLLKDNSSAWKFIKKTEPSILGRRGEYYFCKESNYCLIRPEKFQLFDA